MQISVSRPSTVEGRKRELGEDLYIVHWAIINQANSKDTQNKTKQHTKPNNKTRTNQNRTHKNEHPVHYVITSEVWPKARKQTKQKGNQTHTRPYTQVREATQHHAETGDLSSQDPEITWRKPNAITTHPLSLRSKQRQRRVATRVREER